MFCVECNEKLCESCIAAHRKMKLSKGHQLVPLGSDNVGQLDQLMKNKAVNCEVHPDERIDFFCLTCSSTVCMKCCMLQHKTHDYKDIAEVGLVHCFWNISTVYYDSHLYIRNYSYMGS